MPRFRPILYPALAATLLAAAAARAEPPDNCATVLGSLSVELRYARTLPPGRKTTFACPKRFTPLLGASRERILRSLGTPDATAADGGWSYFFASHYAGREPGTPELVFRFDGAGVSAVDCRRTR
jgi:hypothetical protein